jgi:hypothetical protein
LRSAMRTIPNPKLPLVGSTSVVTPASSIIIQNKIQSVNV